FGEHRFMGHAKVAVGVIVGDKAFVSPVPGHQPPRETASEFIRGEQSIKSLRRRSARERHTKSTLRRQRRLRHPLRHVVRQRQQIRQYLDAPDGLTHNACYLAEPRMKDSIALAKPSLLYESVTAAACALTSSEALPMAILKPDRLNISTSFGWSPMVAISSAGTPTCCERY